MARIPALDGMRAVAIAMVVGYHVDKGIVPAGHWGVILFFVMSGYLVTRVLVAELDRSHRIDLRSFYLKRVLRLVPALVLVGLAVLVMESDWSRVAASLGFYSNYARIGGLELGLLTHTWFLAVLAHFYLVWPIVIAVVPERHRSRTIAGLALVSIAWRVSAIFVVSPAWVYNASDTNAAALLAGCWLAVAPDRQWRFAGWAIPALLGLMLLPAFGDRGSAVLWGGFVAIALGVLAVHYALTRPRWLEHPALVWAGSISYGLYLWHYLFVRSDIPVWVALPASLAAAVATWYLVEQPIERLRRRRGRRAFPSV